MLLNSKTKYAKLRPRCHEWPLCCVLSYKLHTHVCVLGAVVAAESVSAWARLGTSARVHSFAGAHKTAALHLGAGAEFIQHPHRDVAIDSRHLIFWHFNFTPQLWLAPSSLSCPSLSYSLGWSAIPPPSVSASCHLVQDRIEFDAVTGSLRDFLCSPIRSACSRVAGRSSARQHGALHLIHSLSLHLFLSIFFCPSFTSCHCLTSTPFIPHSLALARVLRPSVFAVFAVFYLLSFGLTLSLWSAVLWAVFPLSDAHLESIEFVNRLKKILPHRTCNTLTMSVCRNNDYALVITTKNMIGQNQRHL